MRLVDPDEVPTLVEAPSPSPLDPVLAAIAKLEKRMDQAPATASAELTLTRKAARWRGIAAVVASIAGITYAAFTAAYDHATGENDDRIETVERKLDRLAEDVAELVRKTNDRAAP